MQRVIIIDGHAILHRAYHALPPLTNSRGEPVNAVYGFLSMLIRVIQDLKPTHIAVAFDLPQPTFRKKLFENYQTHRPKMDDGLSSQIKVMMNALDGLGIAVFSKEGFEADDVIGTIARKAVETENSEAVIVTGDRDILQLVSDKV